MKTIIGKDKTTVVLTGVSGMHYKFFPHNVVSSVLLGEKHVPKIFIIISKEVDETGVMTFQPTRIGMVDDLEALIEKVHSLYQEKIGTGSFYYSDLDDSSTEDRLQHIIMDVVENREEYPHLVLIHCPHQ